MFWLCCPDFTHIFVGREATEGLQPLPEVIGCHEVVEMDLQLLMAITIEALDGCLFDGPVHPLHLTIRPEMIGFCQTAFEELPSRLPVCFLNHLCDGKFTHSINGCKEIQLALSDLDLRNIEMKEPNRVAFETLPFWLYLPQCPAGVKSQEAEQRCRAASVRWGMLVCRA